MAEAGRRGFHEVLALTRRTSFFERLGFQATRRERFLDKLMVDCQTCPMNLCCDETAMVTRRHGATDSTQRAQRTQRPRRTDQNNPAGLAILMTLHSRRRSHLAILFVLCVLCGPLRSLR